jgi:hypothetical protein
MPTRQQFGVDTLPVAEGRTGICLKWLIHTTRQLKQSLPLGMIEAMESFGKLIGATLQRRPKEGMYLISSSFNRVNKIDGKTLNDT